MNAVVIGGGPAGMLAAVFAAENGQSVTLLEQNEKLGKKLYITGKGRCNLTNAAAREEFFANIPRNPRFLYSAFAGFDNQDVMRLVEDAGVPLKTERGGRVFPASDKSSDVLRALERRVRTAGVDVRLNTKALEILHADGRVTGVRTAGGVVPADAVIVATGGASYPATGSTGDGYRFAKDAGHTVEPPRPSLVPLETVETWPYKLTGITLKNVTLSAERGGKRVYSELGELLFTHFGVSGPLVLTLSTRIADAPEGVRLSIDLKPGLTSEQLDARLLRDLSENAKKRVGAALSGLLPGRLLETVFALANVDPAMPAGEFNKAKRRALAGMLKGLPLTVKCARTMEEAIVTRGGVSVREVDASTMQSKKLAGLYFAGEVLDVDGETGGFNLQIAWSTGAAAGRHV